MRVTIFTIAPKRPLEGFLLRVFVTLGSMCSEFLVVEGEMHPPGHIVLVPLNWKLRLSLDHFRLLIPLNQEAEKEVTVLAGMTNPN